MALGPEDMYAPLDRRGLNTTDIPVTGEAEASWGEARIARDEAVLTTKGLACCIGIAVYDPLSSTGYLAHVLSTFENHVEAAIPMVEEASARAADPSRLMAWVRGGSAVLEDHDPHYPRGRILRSQTVRLLERTGITGERLDIRWNSEPFRIIDMSLDCKDGALVTPDSGGSL